MGSEMCIRDSPLQGALPCRNRLLGGPSTRRSRHQPAAAEVGGVRHLVARDRRARSHRRRQRGRLCRRLYRHWGSSCLCWRKHPPAGGVADQPRRGRGTAARSWCSYTRRGQRRNLGDEPPRRNRCFRLFSDCTVPRERNPTVRRSRRHGDVQHWHSEQRMHPPRSIWSRHSLATWMRPNH